METDLKKKKKEKEKEKYSERKRERGALTNKDKKVIKKR